MKIKNIIIALVVTLVGFSVQAQDASNSDLAKQKKSKNEFFHVKRILLNQSL